jgi:hypothetical protein
MPLNVSTLISELFKPGSSKIADLTLVVMTLSSTYSPVPSCVRVDAQLRGDHQHGSGEKRGERFDVRHKMRLQLA